MGVARHTHSFGFGKSYLIFVNGFTFHAVVANMKIDTPLHLSQLWGTCLRFFWLRLSKNKFKVLLVFFPGGFWEEGPDLL